MEVFYIAGAGLIGGVAATILTLLYKYILEQNCHLKIETQYNEMNKQASVLQHEITQLSTLMQTVKELKVSAIIVADEAGLIVDWNLGATILFQYSSGEIVGQKISILVPQNLITIHEKAFQRAVNLPKNNVVSSRTLDTRALRKDGTEIPVRITINPWKYFERWLYSAEIRRI